MYKLVVEAQTLWAALAVILVLWVLYDLFIDNLESTTMPAFFLKSGGCLVLLGLFMASIFNNPILTFSLVGSLIALFAGYRLLSR